MQTLIAIVAGFVLAQDPKETREDTIDIVFAIDCSGSMGGVIETAKRKVWSIVNEVAKDRPKAILRIGLIGYGNSDQTYRFFKLTDDLDAAYKHLMTFKDEGWGNEWVGRAIDKARSEINWRPGNNTLKILFVVGNETAHQGPDKWDYRTMAREAMLSDIIVNAVYCGTTQYATATPTWREFSRIAEGMYQEIGAEGGAVQISTPYDKKLDELGRKLNGTYIPYGAHGKEGKMTQAEQDSNAKKMAPGVAAERAQAKASGAYRNGRWDLVDACKDEAFELDKLADDELPEPMKGLNEEERKAYVEKMAEQRADLQSEIKKLSEERDAWLREEIAKRGENEEKAFHVAARKALREQAERKGSAFGR